MINSNDIIQAVSKVVRIAPDVIISLSRTKGVPEARFMIMAKMKEQGWVLEEIGRKISRDHSTVMNGLRKHEDLMFMNPEYARKFKSITVLELGTDLVYCKLSNALCARKAMVSVIPKSVRIF